MFAPNLRDEGEALPPVPSLTAVSTGQPYPARKDGHAPDGIHTPKSLDSREVFAGRGGAVMSQQSGELFAPGSEERKRTVPSPQLIASLGKRIWTSELHVLSTGCWLWSGRKQLVTRGNSVTVPYGVLRTQRG